jgi:hypothetical protein
MSTLSPGAERGTAQTAVRADVTSSGLGGVGTYLTNEVFLYRVVGIVATDAGEVVELEDCYSLDVARVPINDFHAGGLRVVTPAAVNH